MTFSASEVASQLGTDAKTLRRFLRANDSYRNPGSGARYEFQPNDVEPLSRSFQAWQGTRRSKNTKPVNATNKNSAALKSGSKNTRAAAESRVDRLEKSLKDRGVHISQHDDQIMRPEMMMSDSEPTGSDLIELCEVCGEPCDNETGMFFDPAEPEIPYVAHADCGLNKGWSLA